MLGRMGRKTQGGLTEIKNSKGNLLMWDTWDDKSLHLYTAYRTERTTKKLVWATWFLAVGTLILSMITLYLAFFAKTS